MIYHAGGLLRVPLTEKNHTVFVSSSSLLCTERGGLDGSHPDLEKQFSLTRSVEWGFRSKLCHIDPKLFQCMRIRADVHPTLYQTFAHYRQKL